MTPERLTGSGIMQFTLKNGTVTQIDDEDMDLVSPHGWCSSHQRRVNRTATYIIGRIKFDGVKKSIGLHRFIIQHHAGRLLTREEIIDHINGDTLDNRKQNLRIVTHSQNKANTARRSGKGLPKGVTHSRYGKIRKDGLPRYIASFGGKHLGTFLTPEAASAAYVKAAEAKWGDYHRAD